MDLYIYMENEAGEKEEDGEKLRTSTEDGDEEAVGWWGKEKNV